MMSGKARQKFCCSANCSYKPARAVRMETSRGKGHEVHAGDLVKTLKAFSR